MSELKVTYKLAELPSAQHRAGLAGLVMMVNWLNRVQPSHPGICKIKIDTAEANFTIDKEGLQALLLEHFAGTRLDKWYDKLNKVKTCDSLLKSISFKNRKGKSKNKLPLKLWQYVLNIKLKKLVIYILLINYFSNKTIVPLDIKKSEETNKDIFLYEDFSIKLGIIEDLDSTQEKLWLYLWKNAYNTFYKQGTTRYPYQYYESTCPFRTSWKQRSEDAREKKIEEVWKQLDKNINVELKGYKFLGSAKHNAELIPFQDRGKTDFLLNFWIYAVQIYVPIYRKLENKKYKPAKAGYAVVIPDIVDLESFCEDFPEALRESRGENQKAHYFFKSIPEQAIINLAPAAGLDFLYALRKQLARKSRDIDDTVIAVEVYLIDSDKNQYWIEDLARIYPDVDSENEFIRVREYCLDDTFITQRLRNILDGNSWHYGFSDLCSAIKNINLIFGQDSKFCHDARKSFINEVTGLNQVKEEKLISLEAMIYKIVEIYVKKRLKQKYDLEWKDEWSNKKDNNTDNKPKENLFQKQIDNYNDKKRKVALDAFYDCRSRSSIKFCEYFAATFGSVPQGFILKNQESYEKLAKSLFEETDKVKSLTLLALAANS